MGCERLHENTILYRVWAKFEGQGPVRPLRTVVVPPKLILVQGVVHSISLHLVSGTLHDHDADCSR